MRKSYREYRNDFLTVTDRLVGVLDLSKQAATLHNHREVRPACLFHPPGEGDGGFVNLTRVRSQVFSPDASGFTLHRASHYHALRIKRDILSSMRRQVKQKERRER